MNWKSKVAYLLKFIGLFFYLAFGLFLLVLAAGAGAGGLISNDSWSGVWILFTGGILVALGFIGKTMITKIVVSLEDLQKAFKKAAEKIEDESPKKK